MEASRTVRLDVEETERTRAAYEEADGPKTYQKIINVRGKGIGSHAYRTRPDMTEAVRKSLQDQLDTLNKLDD
jgi:hypothetical protein